MEAADALEQGGAGPGRMQDVEQQHGRGDHGALKGDEEVLAAHERPRPAAGELGDAEDAADEDADEAQGQGGEEGAEEARGPHGRQRRVLVEGGGGAEAPAAAQCVERQVGRHEHEDEHGHDLEDEAAEHDVVARLGGLVVCRGDGGHGAAEGLEHEGDDVARDELGGTCVLAVRTPAEEDGMRRTRGDAGRRGAKDGLRCGCTTRA